MTKRNLWGFEETLALIQIIEEKQCLEKIEEKILHPNEVYQIVENEMFARGYYDKNAKQMRFRWQNLRKIYYRDRKITEKGLDKKHKKSPYYDRMDSMLASRWARRKEENTIDEEGIMSCDPIIEEENSPQNSSDEEGTPTTKTEMPTFEECFPTLPIPAPVHVPAPLKPRVSIKRPRTPESTTKVDKFQEKIKRITKDLNQDLFQKQKELVEYEFRLFANYTSDRDNKFKEMMATNTQTFLSGIRDLLQDKTKDIKPRTKQERRLQDDDRNITQFFETWDSDAVHKK